MRVLKPTYYDKFECIANKCSDSCCIGWRIEIDKSSFKHYRKVKGEFGEILNKGIRKNRNDNNIFSYGIMNLTKDQRCSLLNKDNLCNIYIYIYKFGL